MTHYEIVDELTYRNYSHNRRISPHVTVERWRKAYGPQTDEMESRFQNEFPAASTEVTPELSGSGAGSLDADKPALPAHDLEEIVGGLPRARWRELERAAGYYE